MNVILLMAMVGDDFAKAEDTPNISADRAASLARLAKIAESYTITMDSGGDKPLELVKAPVLRYSDPVSSISDGAIFVWTNEGRPEAVMGVHPGSLERTWFELQSLSLSPLHAAASGQPEWTPGAAGLEFKPVGGASPPAKTPAERLVQMRSLLRPFSASISDNKSGKQELRLLSQPTVRYSQSERGILDGGLFVFVRATNPELLIVVESQGVNDKAQWLYSPARFTGRECELRYQDEPIWSHGAMKRPKDSSATYFQSY